MNDKELWELMSIICEGQDSEQRRKVEQYITDLQKEIERLNNIINSMNDYLVMNIANGGLDFMYRQGFRDSYERLQELKGSDK